MAVRDLHQVRSLRVRLRSVHGFVGGLVLATLLVVAFGQSQSAGAALPPGFQESVAFSGLDHPTALRFSPDGRIFVAEKNGRIKVFDNLADTTPTLFADLSTNVYNFWDRGSARSRARSGIPQPTVRLRSLHVRPRAGKRGARAPLGDARSAFRSVPDAAGADG